MLGPLLAAEEETEANGESEKFKNKLYVKA